MPVTLRRCTADDLDILRALSISTYSETFSHMNTPENMDAYLSQAFHAEKLRGELQDPHSEFYFLYHDDRLAGYLKLNEAPSQTDLNDAASLEIERIYVSADAQGEGLGRFLMDHAIATAAARKKQYLWLGVWEKNKKAIRFYENNGFYKVGTHSFFMGEEEQTDHIMRKDLP